MTSRERVRAVLRGEKPDRAPLNFWMDRDKMEEYDKTLGEDFRISYYGADVKEAFTRIVWFADLVELKMPEKHDGFSLPCRLPNLSDWKTLNMPSIDHEDMLEDIRKQRTRYPDIAIFANATAPFEVLLRLRGYQNLFMDMYDSPCELKDFAMAIGDVLAAAVKRILDDGSIDALYLMGDICDNSGPMVSLEHLKEFWMEPMRKSICAVKDKGIPVLYHTDGRVVDMLELFIEAGIDGINPLQYDVNELVEFRKRAGKQLILYGGLDNRVTIPNASPGEVRLHVRNIFETLKDGKGLIFSSHDIPGSTPKEVLDAMVDEIKHCTY
jgi:uroporphyrinogen-III decarboxylase